MQTYDKKSYDKKSGLSIFGLWTPELNNSDLKTGLLVKNCVSILILRTIGLNLGQNTSRLMLVLVPVLFDWFIGLKAQFLIDTP